MLKEYERRKEQNKPKIVIVEEMKFDVAKKIVEKFMIKNKTSDIEKLHQKLHIDIEQLIDIIDEFKKENKIQEVKNAAV